jgi:6-phosphogluconolactonase
MKSLQLFFLGAFAICALAGATMADVPIQTKYWVFIGTGGGKLAKGIYRCEFDSSTGKLSEPELAAEIGNPNFLAIHPNGKFLYCVGEVNVDGKKQGGVTAFSLDAKLGKIEQLNQQAVRGNGPCHLVVDPQGKRVYVANYGDGSTNAFPIGDDGKLKEIVSFVKHVGKGANPKRQEGPHAHSINVSKDGRFAIVADLGIDSLSIYKLDPDKGFIPENAANLCKTAPGAGPRHFAFHPNGKMAFVINELDSTLSSLHYDPKTGELTTLKTVSTLPEDFKGTNTTAEVVVHPNGKFVYGSNRGHDSIAVFKLDEKTGDLTFVARATEGIKEPRNFNIDPMGRFVVAGSQRSNQVVVFKVNQETGALSPTGQSVEVGTPICIKFVPMAK